LEKKYPPASGLQVKVAEGSKKDKKGKENKKGLFTA